MNSALSQENARLKDEVAELRAQLHALEQKLDSEAVRATPEPRHPQRLDSHGHASAACPAKPSWEGVSHDLTKAQIERYNRQILLPSFGVRAQDRLCKAAVLVIGAGGLGCPAAIYLAAAGVGRLGIVDKDAVDASNLHRQILHTEHSVGVHKAESAAAACRALNSSIQVTAHTHGFHPGNALELVGQYDVVVDASDNPPTRYLISDACCAAKKPLVFGAAIGTDGQLTVYCHDNGPCYRCVFPDPPAPENCSRCSEAGVLGPVPGVIGTMQALEAIKLITGVGPVLSQKLLVADMLTGRYMTVKLRGKQPGCKACGLEPEITAATLPALDYAAFTGQQYDDKLAEEVQVIPAEQRVTATELAASAADVVLDVRPDVQYDAAHIPGSMHVTFDEHHPERFASVMEEMRRKESRLRDAGRVVVVCRRGNDSQRVVQILRDRFQLQAVDLQGGLLDWSRTADPSFPAV